MLLQRAHCQRVEKLGSYLEHGSLLMYGKQHVEAKKSWGIGKDCNEEPMIFNISIIHEDVRTTWQQGS